MFASWITPRVVLVAMAIHIALWSLLEILGEVVGRDRLFSVRGGVRLGCGVLAYGVAIGLNLEIAREYRQALWLKVAWLALAANAAIFLFRPLVESPITPFIAPEYLTRPLLGLLLHLLIIPANICVLIGVLAMWRAYHKVGLGFRIELRDYAAMAGVLLLSLAVFIYRENLSESQSPYLTSRILQPVGLILLSICAALSLGLHRLAVQMGGGQLARALRWLTLYVLVRGVLVLLNAARPEFVSVAGPSVVRSVFDIGWQLVPWIVVLAAACRAELTVKAARELEQRRAAKGELVPV